MSARFLVTPMPIDPGHLSVSPRNGNGTNGYPNGGNGHAPRPTQANGAQNGQGGSQPSNGGPPVLLAELVARAEASTGELERLARTALDATAASTQAASELQERLRLGVRMLQAFEVQIQRSEQANGNAGVQAAAQFTNHVSAVAQQCEMRVRASMEALERRIAESVPFLDERLRQAHEQVGRIVEDRLGMAERRIEERYGPARDELRMYADGIAADFATRLDTLVEERVAVALSQISQAERQPQPTAQADMTEAMLPLASIEERVRVLLSEAERRSAAVDDKLAQLTQLDDRLTRLDRLIKESTEAADALLGTVGTAATLKDLVADDAAASRRMADESQAVTRELQREMLDLVEKASLSRSAIQNELHEFNQLSSGADSRVATIKGLHAELDTLLTRLAPWESLARREGTPMQQVVDTISTGVRQSIGEDMRSFSHALRQLAGRAEQSFALGRFDEFSAAAPVELPTPAEQAPETTSIAAPHLPIDTHRLTAEILALDTSSLMRAQPSL